MSRSYQPNAAFSLQGQQDSITVHDNDVLSGRGVNIAQHPGNERFRSLVNTRHDENYCTAYTTTEKRAVAEEILRYIKSLNPPGRFLRRTGRSTSARGLQGPWEELSDREAVKKTCQALRDCNRNDRTGYAASVSMPDDVRQEAHVRQSLGMTNKDLAAAAAAKNLKRDISVVSSSTNASMAIASAAAVASSAPNAATSSARPTKVPIAPAPVPLAPSSHPVPIAMRPDPQQHQHLQPSAHASLKRSGEENSEDRKHSPSSLENDAAKKQRTGDQAGPTFIPVPNGAGLPLVTPAGGMGYASFDSFFGASYDFSVPAATPETAATMGTTPSTGSTNMSAVHSMRSSMSPAAPVNIMTSTPAAYDYHPGINPQPAPHMYPPGAYYMPPPHVYPPYAMHPDPLAPPSPAAHANGEVPMYYHPFQHHLPFAPPNPMAAAQMKAPYDQLHQSHLATLDTSSADPAATSNGEHDHHHQAIHQHQQFQDAAEAAAAAADGHSPSHNSPSPPAHDDFGPSASPNPFDNEDEHLTLP